MNYPEAFDTMNTIIEERNNMFNKPWTDSLDTAVVLFLFSIHCWQVFDQQPISSGEHPTAKITSENVAHRIT